MAIIAVLSPRVLINNLLHLFSHGIPAGGLLIPQKLDQKFPPFHSGHLRQ